MIGLYGIKRYVGAVPWLDYGCGNVAMGWVGLGYLGYYDWAGLDWTGQGGGLSWMRWMFYVLVAGSDRPLKFCH